MSKTFIIDGIRSPIGKFGGLLSHKRTDDLAADVIKALMNRNPNIDWERTDDVYMGCANQAGEDNRNVARMALLLAGLPWSVPGETVNRLCASGLSANIHAHQANCTGFGKQFIAGGVENMTRGPYVISKSARPFGTDSKMYDSSFGWRFINPRMKELYGTHGMGETAENLADKYNISRERQDEFAYQSQRKTKVAMESGRLAREIIPITIPRRKKEDLVFEKDEFPRPDTTIDVLSQLRPAFKKDGSVTAGNSSGLNDGAAAILLLSGERASEYGVTPMAEIISSAVVGVEPHIMGIGPVGASKKALDRANLSLDEMDVIELNEAFSVQVLACLEEMELEPDDKRLNPNGGSIALGHPLGMTGARLLLSAAHELVITGKKYALVTMCVGVGQGYAAVIKRVEN